MPGISILLPNLNQRTFLPERLESIARQTYTDWELIVVDNGSDDGAWEFFQDEARKEPRMRISQAPRTGVYENWNNCLRLARGEFVYFATSDDLMAPDCLEKLHRTLVNHPECGLAHCCLEIIDETGQPLSGLQSWAEQPLQKYYFTEWMNRKHIRPAPHDGILHAATGTVYTSITQLLIRRSVFDHIGLFRTEWGSAGDFEWDMRASLLYDTIHVPEVLASWRRHSGQLTRDECTSTSENRRKMAEMVEAAVHSAIALEPDLAGRIDGRRLSLPFRHQSLLLQPGGAGWKWWLQNLFNQSGLVGLYLRNRFVWKKKYHRCHLQWIRSEMKNLGVAALREVS